MIQAAVEAGRRSAESLMVDTFTLARPTGAAPAYKPDTQGEVEPTDALGTSAGKLQSRNLVASEVEVGGRTAVTVRVELHLPVSAVALQTGDIAELTAAGPSTPASLLNTRWRVLAPVGKTWATAARYEVEEIV